MNVEYWINSWIEHKKNRGYDRRQGVANGTIVAKLYHIATEELVIEPVRSEDKLTEGRGVFTIMMKPIDRWIVCSGEFVTDNTYPIYRKNFWGKKILIGRGGVNMPLNGMILKIDNVKFYKQCPLWFDISEYRITNGVWKKVKKY